MLIEIIKVLGVPGLITAVLYRLTDKYLGKFIVATEKQAEAIQSLASSVQEGSTGQKDVLLAVRVLTAKMDESMGWMRQIDQRMQGIEVVKH